MKIKIYILLSILMFCNLELKSQCALQIDTVSFSYFNGLTKQAQTINDYRITNNSNEDYLTWVSLISTNNKSDIELIQNFFKKRKGDFNLIEMMNENLLDEQPINIGYSFIKNIAAGETFSYFIEKTDSNSTFYEERIVIIKKREVEQYLNMQIEKKYFFPLTNIFLTKNDEEKIK